MGTGLALAALALTPSFAHAATEADTLSRTPSAAGTVINDTTATGSKAQLLWANGSISTTTTNPLTSVTFRSRGDQCGGAPQAQLLIDGKSYGTTNISWSTWTDTKVALPAALAAGTHTITLSYGNDPETLATCDRNLYLDWIDTAAPVAPVASGQIEADTLTRTPSAAGTVVGDTTATGAKSQLLWANGAIALSTQSSVGAVNVRVKGDQCVGAPQLQLSVDGKLVGTKDISWSDWATTQFKLPTGLAAGAHAITATYANDPETSANCDRNLRVDWFSVEPAGTVTAPVKPTTPVVTPPVVAPPVATTPVVTPPVVVTPSAPVTGPGKVPVGGSGITKLYRNPNSQAAYAASQARAAGKYADATLIDKMALTPSSVWLGGYTGDDKLLDDTLAGAAAEGSRVMYTVYGIPNRDVGQYAAAGGGFSAAGYRSWINGLASKIGKHATMIILEPDAMGQPLATTAAQNERWSLLTYAIQTLGALPDTAVYLDAANSAWGWKPADMAARLKSAGVQYADGIAVNTSNFNWTKDELAYGRAILSSLGSKQHMVIDTSRNGKGPIAPGTSTNAEDYWCNPVNRGLGAKPTMDTGVADVDAYVWAKRPGETDGPCHGGPPSGFFYADALTLARNAAW